MYVQSRQLQFGELIFGTLIMALLSGPVGLYLGDTLSIPDFAGSLLFILACVGAVGVSYLDE